MRKLSLSFFLLITTLVSHAQTGKDQALSSLGALAGATIYNTYSVIGSVWDNYVQGNYDKEFALSIANEQSGMLSNLENSLNQLKDSGFLTDPADVTYVSNVIDCLNLLTNQALAMENYINNPSAENSDAFQTARTKSWSLISQLLGFE